ncbi:unnamed protein product [Paramecium octaurelia]|uniref:Regulator of nonsense transcripts 1 n=1 Tax=Paramecium octaurelia TaxID=43137 RepID=A0A8S1YC17_PAROT|nr:unnamed protein product [Paramecium octaurelia]
MTEILDKIKRATEQQLQIADYSCEYCLQSDVNAVAQCLQCKRWYCNCATKSGSHIILHLIKSKHSQISLHEQNKVQITTIECYICEQRNMFTLGQVNVKVDGEENILILCRGCLPLKQSDKITWDSNDYQPLIKDKCIQDWLLGQGEKLNSRMVTLERINQYEEERKQKPQLKFEDFDRKGPNQQLKEVQLRYKDANHYQQVFSPLVKLEEEQDKQVKEGQVLQSVKVKWDLSLKKKRLAYFLYGGREEFDTNTLQGSEMQLSLKSGNSIWQSKGTVVKVINNEEICLELHQNDPPPNNADEGYTVECIWVSTTFKRMQIGLKTFNLNESSTSNYIYKMILGRIDTVAPPTKVENIPQKLSAPNLPDLNVYQADAVKKALKSPLSLIQGPPGTGKTVTSATIVYQLVKALEKQKQRGQILVCAPSNIVVDQLAEKINKTGVKVVRLCSKTRESVSTTIEFLTLHNQVRSLDIPQYHQLQMFYELMDQQGELDQKDEQVFIRMRDEAEKEIIEQADIICTTCIGSADKRLKDMRFPFVLIDEATQAIEPECLLPMIKGAQHVILVGDHRQLGPVVQSREAASVGLDRSLFERLVQLGIRPVRLQVQYRMHPELTVFPSNTFYEGTLQNGVTISDRTHSGNFPWPNKQKPMIFINVQGQEQLSASGTSYLNTQEAVAVEQAVYYLYQNTVKLNKIGIITPYKGQRTYIISYLQKNGQLPYNQYRDIEVASVDGFQGREKDFIIISCVRSNDTQGIGFLTNPRRLNVTITRARFGLIIIGNARVLCKDNLWNNMLNHFKDLDLLMEGSLPNLKPCHMKFRPPQKFIPERRNNTMNGANDDKSVYSYAQTDNLNQFDHDLGDFPLTKGIRNSEFGFNYIPDTQAFVKVADQNDIRKNQDIKEIDQANIITVGQYPSSIMQIGTFQNDLQLDV